MAAFAILYFLIIIISSGVREHLKVLLICIPHMDYGGEKKYCLFYLTFI